MKDGLYEVSHDKDSSNFSVIEPVAVLGTWPQEGVNN